MNIFVYSDESGVLDYIHHDYYIFGGLIFLDKDSRDENSRKYSHAEKVIRETGGYDQNYELKAFNIKNNEKGKLYRSLNNCYKFGAIIRQKDLLPRIFNSKKDKQRYLDYAYKIAVKRAFENLIDQNILDLNTVEHIYFYADEHTTATNGLYELQESLEQEFKYGMFNYNYSKHFPPLFPNLRNVVVKYCNSCDNYLVRAADIVSNHIYHQALSGIPYSDPLRNLFIVLLP